MRLPWLSFARWSSASGEFFVRERLYWRGFRWTPFVLVRWRHGWFKSNSMHFGGPLVNWTIDEKKQNAVGRAARRAGEDPFYSAEAADRGGFWAYRCSVRYTGDIVRAVKTPLFSPDQRMFPTLRAAMNRCELEESIQLHHQSCAY